MVKWSRVQLVLSVITAAGLWQTARERVAFARSARTVSDTTACSGILPTHHDLAGVLHIHSNYSDGLGTIDEIAEAAKRAGADVVLICDHSTLKAQETGESGWRADGSVLVAVGTEVTTDCGHLLLLGVPTDMNVTPGSASEIMRRTIDVGGFGYIALPCDLKDHWRDFSIRHESFGIEVFNLSSIARTKINIPGFLLALARYTGKKPLTAFNLVAGRPTTELNLWDRLAREAFAANKPIPNALGTLDAHAVMRIGGKNYPYPTYEEVFRTCRTHVFVSENPSRTRDGSAKDTTAFNEALQRGHSYISYDNYGDPTGFTFELRTDKEQVAIGGDTFLLNAGTLAYFEVRTPNPRSIIRLLRDGKIVAKVRGQQLHYDVTTSGVYRVEADNYTARIGPLCLGVHPWIFSNPITVRSTPTDSSAR